MSDMTIDLHGLIEEEASTKVQMALMDFSVNQELNSLEIITGNGRVLKSLTIDILEDEGMNYYIPSDNTGTIIVER